MDAFQGAGAEQGVWDLSESFEMDDEFKDFFLQSFKLEQKTPKGVAARRRRSTSKMEEELKATKVLSDQRRQNISIVQKTMGLRGPQIAEALRTIDMRVLTEENLNRIGEMCATAKEIEDIQRTMAQLTRKRFKRQSNIGDKLLQLFPEEEQMMVELYRIKNVEDRVKNLIFTHTFGSDFAHYSNSVKLLHGAVNVVQAASREGQLGRILNNVLRFINMLNESSAAGFRISTLKKLSAVKMTKGKGSLMDVIVMHATTIDNERCGTFDDELDGLDEAHTINYNETKGQIHELSMNMESLRQVIEDIEGRSSSPETSQEEKQADEHYMRYYLVYGKDSCGR
mmetsp:Transcript_43905/g.73120  ORF Transcript_43905/g.73120 Transcript_43905/m.73120 type:complete len:340 (+) Transcript_43905:519-1538(+)